MTLPPRQARACAPAAGPYGKVNMIPFKHPFTGHAISALGTRPSSSDSRRAAAAGACCGEPFAAKPRRRHRRRRGQSPGESIDSTTVRYRSKVIGVAVQHEQTVNTGIDSALPAAAAPFLRAAR